MSELAQFPTPTIAIFIFFISNIVTNQRMPRNRSDCRSRVSEQGKHSQYAGVFCSQARTLTASVHALFILQASAL